MNATYCVKPSTNISDGSCPEQFTLQQTNHSMQMKQASGWVRGQKRMQTRLEGTLLLTLLCAQFLSTIVLAHRRPPYMSLQMVIG